MEQFITTGVLFGALILFLASGVWVAFSLLLVGYIALDVFSPAPGGSLLATTVWDASWNWALTALPLFVWMGEILFRTRLSGDLFTGLAPWLSWLPGRLLHVNIVGCGVMAAVAGSSAVTCATVGRMSIPELKRRGYDERMAIGTLAGSGTLGLLIPPSIMLIVYGIVAQQSIARLFIAGIMPGVMLVLMFMGYTAIWAVLHPEKVPPRDIRMGLLEKIWSSRRMIAFILAGAAFLSVAMGFTGIPVALAGWVDGLGLSALGLLSVLTVLFIFLGCFLDGISMLVLTSSVVLPMVASAGIDPLWFGIYLVIVVEMAQITPPVGFNLFVLQGMTGRDILQITRASLPFFFVMLVAIAVITVFPQIVTFLPQLMMSR
jgi:C4-dicarboxylate transporter DctM subunit